MERIRVFVYGTLQPGECNFDLYCAGRVVQMQPAISYGTLFDLPFGYPAMTVGNRPVYGYLLWFSDPAVLVALDELEDFDPCRPADRNEYVRVEQAVFDLEGRSLGDAWVYLMQPKLVERVGGIRLPQGKWTAIRELT